MHRSPSTGLVSESTVSGHFLRLCPFKLSNINLSTRHNDLAAVQPKGLSKANMCQSCCRFFASKRVGSTMTYGVCSTLSMTYVEICWLRTNPNQFRQVTNSQTRAFARGPAEKGFPV